MRDPCGGGNVECLDYGGGCMNLQVIKLHRTKHAHTHTQEYKSNWGKLNFNGLYRCQYHGCYTIVLKNVTIGGN